MTVLSDSLIVAVSPAVGSAFSSVMVQDDTTQQASVLDSGFTYQSPLTTETFSFGGCHATAQAGPTGWRDALAGSLWFLMLLGGLGVRARQASRA
ncbi:MAG: hypothetical protein R3E96_11185 [Planctomycetota bacterium]